MKKPNIVMITLDECKASALGCYGNEDAVSPTIDQLAKEGVIFSESYTTFPKCVPARASIFTSRYPHVEGHRTLPGFEIRKGENNLVLEMKKAGYITAMFGKNHTIEEDFLPQCFDEFNSERIGQDVPWKKRDFENDETLFRAFYRGDFSNLDEMSDTIATNHAIDFLKRRKDEQFFLLINYNDPHPPYTDIEPFISIIREKNIKLPPREDIEHAPEILKAYRKVYNLEGMTDDGWRKIVEAYYGMVTYVDQEVSKILNALINNGLREDTLIIFTSDHGDFAGEHGCVEKWDTMFYDCLIKVPLIFSLPSNYKQSKKIDAMVENIDIAPTILDLCGLQIPFWMQGKSLVDILSGKTDKHKDAVFCEGGVEEAALEKSLHYNSEEHRKRHPNYVWKQILMVDYPFTMVRAKMVRTLKWKLIYRINGVKELYDLENDPTEFSDVSKDPKNNEVIYELMERLLNWEIRTETDYPEIITMYS